MNVRVFVIACLMIPGLSFGASAAVELIDACFAPDVRFPDYDRFWEGSKQLGGFVHVFLRNSGDSALTIEDASLEGISLSEAIAFSEQRKFRKHAFAASSYFSKLSQEQKDKLNAAGEPVWWKFEPQTLQPGECGELIIRLRRQPASATLNSSLNFKGFVKQSAPVTVGRVAPRFEAICFSFGRDTAYLYLTRAGSSTPPLRITFDGADITADVSIPSEPFGDTVPVICKLKSPLARASYHCFQAVYPDGEKATAGIRVWDDDFAYGMWGAMPSKAADTKLATAYFNDLADHGINVQMEQIGSEAVAGLMKSEEGRKLMDTLGISRMIADPGKGGTTSPWAYFLMDEPDAGDFKVQGIPENARVGSLGQGLADRAYELRQTDPVTPQLLNVDMTYKPTNWYTYAQLPDILTADPYYQNRLAQAYRKSPEQVELYKQAHYVHAVADICRSAQAPKPTDLVIFTGSPGDEKQPFRFATPEEKRIECYYALGSGVKGISYWWFHSLAQGLRPGATDSTALAQWREIGLLGAELRTIGPLIVTGCLARARVEAPSKLWVRSLLRGQDTLILVCVNDDYVNDRSGTKFTPIDKPTVTVDLPAWFAAKNVFEVGYKGTGDVKWDRTGSKLNVQFDRVDLTRLVVVTTDPDLRARLQKLYDEKSAAKVAKLLSGQIK